MTIAYLLLVVEGGKEQSTIEKLKQHKEVKEAHVVSGQYDIVAKVEFRDIQDIQSFVLKHIRPMSEIRATSTMIGMA